MAKQSLHNTTGNPISHHQQETLIKQTKAQVSTTKLLGRETLYNKRQQHSSMEELDIKHKKALKALDGEKRAAIKKAKGTKGKKAKQAVADVEEEFATKLKELEASHQVAIQELKALGGDGVLDSTPDVPAVMEGTAALTIKDDIINTAKKEGQDDDDGEEDEEDAGLSAKERKQAKARRKKERQRERELQRQRELEEEAANAGPSAKHMETEQLTRILEPLNMKVAEVAADGHCLYRAVGAQTNQSYAELRSLCARTLQQEKNEFAPFCEYTDAVPDFDAYVERVASSAEWGGHLELRALGMALQRPIHVYSVPNGSKPLEIEPPSSSSLPPIRLSYHLHFYGLGEHYNQVIEKTTTATTEQ